MWRFKSLIHRPSTERPVTRSRGRRRRPRVDKNRARTAAGDALHPCLPVHRSDRATPPAGRPPPGDRSTVTATWRLCRLGGIREGSTLRTNSVRDQGGINAPHEYRWLHGQTMDYSTGSMAKNPGRLVQKDRNASRICSSEIHFSGSCHPKPTKFRS